MNDLVLARLRPRGHAPADIRDALAALAEERTACERRAASARSQRVAALIAGVSWQVCEADTALKAADADMEMMAAMEPALHAKLASAEAIEAGAHARVAEANAAAEAAVAAFSAALPRYPKHAQAVAEIARLGEAAGHAMQHATALARTHNVQGPVVEIPGAVGSNPTGYAIPLAALVRLPAPDGNGLLFGQWGPEHRLAPAFRYR